MQDNNEKDLNLRVFYNSACPVCKAGINKQKKKIDKASVTGKEIQWKDVHANNNLIYDLDGDISLNFVRKRLHVIDANGEVQVGIDAFIALWRISPGERWKAKFFETPVIHGLSALIYNSFAFFLFHWNRTRGSWS